MNPEKENRILKEIIQLTRYDNEDKLYNKILSLIVKYLETDSASLLIPDNEKGFFKFRSAYGKKSDALLNFTQPLDKGIAGYVYKNKKPYMCNTKKSKIWDDTLSKKLNYPTTNILAMPLYVDNSIFGIVEVINKKNGDEFSKKDLENLEIILNQVSLIIHNKMSYKKLLEENIITNTLLSAVKSVGSTLNKQEIMRRILAMAENLTNSERSSIFLYNKDDKNLYFEYASGLSNPLAKKIVVPVKKSLAGAVFTSGKAEIVNNPQNDPRHNKKIEDETGFAIHNILTVPMKVKTRCIGAAQVLNKKNYAKYSKYDQNIFQTFANLISIFLENSNLYNELKETFYAISKALAAAIEQRDEYTGNHTHRVEKFSVAAAKEMGFSREELENLAMAGMLHDIGKIAVPDYILRKNGRLTKEEFDIMKTHPSAGVAILKDIKQLKPVIPGIEQHHERIDGKGYPNGLRGNEISLQARIIGVADAYDAMTSDRPYRKGLDDSIALSELIKFKGTQFDSETVDVFLTLYEKGIINEIQEKYK